VLLAQNFSNEKSIIVVNFNKLVLIRVVIWCIGFICSVLRFHANISYAFTMPIFGILVYYWLSIEIEYYKSKLENRVLVYGGAFSYSLYLIHPGVFSLFVNHFKLTYLGDNFLITVVAISSSIIVAWIFYELVEKQSHKLAKQIRFKN
ncbi:MAG: hypothetical protein K2Q22_14295, partial [Cytophagales bacterium]|nr:hypothetical protein [Cytophagales bacterium]